MWSVAFPADIIVDGYYQLQFARPRSTNTHYCIVQGIVIIKSESELSVINLD